MILKGSHAKLGLAVAGAATLVLLAGCSQKEPGVATTPPAGGEQTSASQTPTSTAPSTTTSAAKIDDPCALFPDAEAAKMGLATPGQTKSRNGTPECRWTASGQFIATVSSAKNRLANFKGETATLAKHKAIQVIDLDQNRGCSIAMEVSDNLIAFTIVTPVDNSPGAQMCPRALEIAKVVDSKLP